MAEISKWWPGNTVGHAVSFNSDNLANLAYTIYCRQSANKGVLRGVMSELNLTGSSSPLTLAAGAALIRGYEYESNAGISVAVSTPATATRIDRIVLRANWTAQTVTAVLLSGAEGGSAPALTQNFGVTWEIPLWKVTVTTGGVFTLTDEREFCEFASRNHLIGEVIEWYSDTLPNSNYVWANGQAISRTSYAELFALWGTTFGVGDGSTTFNVVDKRGRTAAGKDNMGGASAANRITSGGSGIAGTTLGASGGAENHTLVTAQTPVHNHPVGFYPNDPVPGSGYGMTTFTANGSVSMPNTSNNTGGGGAHQNTQPTIISNFIICAR
jgi:microcystin-dependent protein